MYRQVCLRLLEKVSLCDSCDSAPILLYSDHHLLYFVVS